MPYLQLSEGKGRNWIEKNNNRPSPLENNMDMTLSHGTQTGIKLNNKATVFYKSIVLPKISMILLKVMTL